MKKLLKFISQDNKRRILNSVPYRFYERMKLGNKEIAIRCELTTKCNCLCKMCTRNKLLKSGQLSAGDMDETVIVRMLEEMKKFHEAGWIVTFTVMGLGEPLVCPGLFDVFNRVKVISTRIKIIVVTNGILLEEKMSERLLAAKVDEITVSLNANNSKEYLAMMGVDKYEQVKKNIESLILLRNNRHLTLPSVIIQYLDEGNAMSRFMEDAKQWRSIMRGYDKCYVHPIVNEGSNFDGTVIFGNDMEAFPCVMPLKYLAVNVKGDIYPCDACLFAGGKKVESLYMGNILEKSPFEVMGQENNLRRKIINKMRMDDYSNLPQCKNCSNYKLDCNRYFKLPGKLRIKGFKWI